MIIILAKFSKIGQFSCSNCTFRLHLLYSTFSLQVHLNTSVPHGTGQLPPVRVHCHEQPEVLLYGYVTLKMMVSKVRCQFVLR